MPEWTRAKKRRIEAIIMLGRTNKAIDRLEDRLRVVERKCDDLERAKRNIDLEFTELYDKVRHQMSRMAKRDARAAKANGNELPEVPDNSDSSGLDPISQSIMLRRAGVERKVE